MKSCPTTSKDSPPRAPARRGHFQHGRSVVQRLRVPIANLQSVPPRWAIGTPTSTSDFWNLGVAISKRHVFDVARARASPTTSRLGHSRYSSPSPRRPLCVRRGSRGSQNHNKPLPHHTWAGRRENTGPLARLGSGAREAHRVLGTNLGPNGGLVGACPKRQCSLVPAGHCGPYRLRTMWVAWSVA